MAYETLVAVNASSGKPSYGNGAAHDQKQHISTIEVTSSADVSSTYDMHVVPSSARINPVSSFVYWDDMGTATATLDVGTVSGASYDDDTLNIDFGLVEASGQPMLGRSTPGIEDFGKRLWELHGLTADPGGLMTIRMKIKDSAPNLGGTLTSVCVYTTD